MSRDIASRPSAKTQELQFASQLPELNFLLTPIRSASQAQFDGNLLFSWGNAAPWGLSFRHGRLVWAWAGNHRLRRWRCLLGANAPKTFAQAATQGFASTQPVWEYASLKAMVAQGELEREVAQAIARQSLEEVLFDLVQLLYIRGDTPTLRSEAFKLDRPLKFFAPSEICMMVHKRWGEWCNAELQNYSPMLAPCIYQPEKLQKLMSERGYCNLEKLIQGQLSLRELAILLEQDLLCLSQTLLNYERRHLIKFGPLPQPLARGSSPLPEASASSRSAVASSTVGSSRLQLLNSPERSDGQLPSQRLGQDRQGQGGIHPLVLCIDDSQSTCQQLGQVVEASGYRYAAVQNPTDALLKAIEIRPSLIFLDLVMPGVSGYELCTQLRRVSSLRNIPIVVLTSSDKMIDRVRLKVAGSTLFLKKPISCSVVQRVLASYCAVAA